MFNKNSMLVKTWVSLVMMGVYTVEQVPRLFNLRDVVEQVLAGIINEPA